MKTKVTRKVVLMCSAVLLGIAVCMSFWLFLREHKARNFLTNNELIAERRNTWQAKKNTDENQGHEPLTLEERVERVVQRTKSNFISRLSEEELVRPDIQKRIDVYDSPEYREMVKEMRINGPSHRKWWDVLESQGIEVDRGVFAAVFRKVFPTGEPEDYEPEMRLKMAKLFLAAEPVDLTDPRAAHTQRLEVYSKFMRQEDRNSPWLAGRFDADWDGVYRRKSNPTLEWVRDVQQNAGNIAAAAETAGVDAPETQAAAPSWDLSSVMESPPAFPDEMEGNRLSMNTPPTDALDPTAISNPETDAAATRALNLTDVPKAPTALPTVEGFEASLKEQFSSERFERAMDTLEQYGPEEGLRRLRENDPEVAKQVEKARHHNRQEDAQ